MNSPTSDKVFAALETFRIDLPSWSFANTGTRFGKFIQPAAAPTTEEKFSDAGQVHLLIVKDAHVAKSWARSSLSLVRPAGLGQFLRSLSRRPPLVLGNLSVGRRDISAFSGVSAG
jgi:hypothetical protein